MLSERYGSRFVSQFGEQPGGQWRAELNALERDAFVQGVQKLRTRGQWDEAEKAAWPPSLDEFLAWCHEWTPPPVPDLPRLPPESDEARAARFEGQRAKWREMMAKVRAR